MASLQELDYKESYNEEYEKAYHEGGEGIHGSEGRCEW